MSIDKISAIKQIGKLEGVSAGGSGFKEIMAQKRDAAQKIADAGEVAPATAPAKNGINQVITDAINNHENATNSIKDFIKTRTNYSPEKLLAIQYNTGIMLLREQMFTKTAELSANTLKNFSQMQVWWRFSNALNSNRYN